jgi:hypothetical protein
MRHTTTRDPIIHETPHQIAQARRMLGKDFPTPKSLS